MASQANGLATPETLGVDLPTAIYLPKLLEVNVTEQQSQFFQYLVRKINQHPWPFRDRLEIPEGITINLTIPGKRGGGITGREMFREAEGRGDIPLHVFQNRIFSPQRVIFTPTGRDEADCMSEYVRSKAGKDLLFLSNDQFRLGLKARTTHENFKEVTSLLVKGKELDGKEIIYPPIPGLILSIIPMTEYHGRRELIANKIIPENSPILPLLKRGPVIIFMEPLPYRASGSDRVQWMLDTNSCTHLASIPQVNLGWMKDDPLNGVLKKEAIDIGRKMHASLKMLNGDPRCATLGKKKGDCENRINVVNAALGIINSNLGTLLDVLEGVSKLPQNEQQSWLKAVDNEPMRAISDVIGFVRWRSDVEAMEYEQAIAPAIQPLRLSLNP